MRINTKKSLTWNLEQYGITTHPDEENEGKRRWFRGGQYIGSFDAVEGWTMAAIMAAGGPDWDAAAQKPCLYGDPCCPCQDGDPCHYEGENPMRPPSPQGLK